MWKAQKQLFTDSNVFECGLSSHISMNVIKADSSLDNGTTKCWLRYFLFFFFSVFSLVYVQMSSPHHTNESMSNPSVSLILTYWYSLRLPLYTSYAAQTFTRILKPKQKSFKRFLKNWFLPLNSVRSRSSGTQSMRKFPNFRYIEKIPVNSAIFTKFSSIFRYIRNWGKFSMPKCWVSHGHSKKVPIIEFGSSKGCENIFRNKFWMNLKSMVVEIFARKTNMRDMSRESMLPIV